MTERMSGPDLVLLHTSDAHVARFDALRDRIAPEKVLRHHIRPDWLGKARMKGADPDLEAAFEEFMQAQSAPVLCTCTTLGPLAEKAGAIRIDRPMMQAAARLGPPVLMAYCLESTCAPSMALLSEALRAEGHSPIIRALEIAEAWPAFEAGDEAGFATAIASAIRTHLATFPDTRAIVLAQASMSVAAPLLEGSFPVLTSPESALRLGLGLRDERSAHE